MEVADLPASGSLWLKMAEPEQREPVRVVLTGHQFMRTLAFEAQILRLPCREVALWHHRAPVTRTPRHRPARTGTGRTAPDRRGAAALADRCLPAVHQRCYQDHCFKGGIHFHAPLSAVYASRRTFSYFWTGASPDGSPRSSVLVAWEANRTKRAKVSPPENRMNSAPSPLMRLSSSKGPEFPCIMWIS